MGQETFGGIETASRRRMTKRELFLKKMDEAIPWDELAEVVKPYYHENGKPFGTERMLRMYFLRIWFNLSNEGVEDAIYDSRAFSNFMEVSFGQDDQVPDAAALLEFRRIVEENNLADDLLAYADTALERTGIIMCGGSIVDAELVDTPSPEENANDERDPET